MPLTNPYESATQEKLSDAYYQIEDLEFQVDERDATIKNLKHDFNELIDLLELLAKDIEKGHRFDEGDIRDLKYDVQKAKDTLDEYD